MATESRCKTSLEIDTAKELLGTTTVTKVRQRQTLVELLFQPGALELDNPEVMSGAWL